MKRSVALLLVAMIVGSLAVGAGAAEKKAKGKPKPKKPIATVPADTEKKFEAMDKDRDWRLSLDEFTAGKPDAEKAKQEFKAIDKNKDTFITLWEYKVYMDKKSAPTPDKKDEKKDDKKKDKKKSEK